MNENRPDVMDELDKAAAMYAPLMIILSDVEIAAKARRQNSEGLTKEERTRAGLEAYSAAMKNHKRETVELLAAHKGVPEGEYYESAVAMIKRFVTILGEVNGVNFTRNAVPQSTATSGGAVTENTGDSEN